MTLHNIPPVYNEESSVLILGSFPSVRSREAAFYYAHPQNRFWKVLAEILGASLPKTVEEKRLLLLSHHIALWDVIASCEITGSSDMSIREVVPNDLSAIFAISPIRKIFCNGGTAFSLYQKHDLTLFGLDAVRLPSTSPANASFSTERLVCEWRQILQFLS